ncbi:MAG: carboxymuconolactone decarboxylase family protein [Pseudomonadales bacterium]
MTRISKIPVEQWDPRLVAATRPEEATDLEQGLTRFMAHAPDLALGMMAFGGALKTKRALPDRLVELVRLRIAFFNQCRSCMAIRYKDAIADGVDEGLVCSLERPEEADNLSAAEKAALHFAELMANDHLAIDDSVYAELKTHFTEPEVIELGLHCSLFVGVGRLAATLHMVEELPEAFRDAGATVSPWGNEAIAVR